MAQRIAHPRAAGTPEASGDLLGELFVAHGRRVYGLCCLLLGDPVDAEDAAQQTFLSAHRSLRTGLVPREPSGWLSAIARNECRAWIRARRHEPVLVPWDGDRSQEDIEEIASRRAEFAALCQALLELPVVQREALVLREFLGLSYREVSTAADVSPTALKSVLFRARRQLKENLRPARVSGGALLTGPLAKLAFGPVAAKVAGATATVAVVGTIGGASPLAPPDLQDARPSPVSARAAEAPSAAARREARPASLAVKASTGGSVVARPVRREERSGPERSEPEPVELEREASEPRETEMVEVEVHKARAAQPEKSEEAVDSEESEDPEPAGSEEDEQEHE